MVYSAIESTCFGLYWSSSGFYDIEEESINAVKTVRGVVDFFSMFTNSSCTRNRGVSGLIYRSLNQHPPHSFYSIYRLFFNIVET